MNINERTYIMIKPSGVQRGLVGEIIKRFEQKGFYLVALKMVQANEYVMRQHYIELSNKSFFPGLIKLLTASPVVCMVWAGPNAVKAGRALIGETNPGTIRGDYCVQTGVDVIHGSDTVPEAEREIALWFRPDELIGQPSPYKF